MYKITLSRSTEWILTFYISTVKFKDKLNE